MIIARAKQKENIAEYILYMWQIEDLIRASGFDIDVIGKNVIEKFDLPEKTLSEMKSWYAGLIERMNAEGIRKRGHLASLSSLMERLNALHLELMESEEQIRYHELYHQALENITSFIARSGKTYSSEIEACFEGLYAYMLLNIQQKEVSKGTREAMKTFSNLLAGLSKQYHTRLDATRN